MADIPVTIYHNPRCGKSRDTLALLEEKGIAPEVIPYLETPPTAGRLREILGMLGMSPRDLMRKTESVYGEQGLDDEELSESELIRAMVENPVLIERPIVVCGDRAALGRPPENVLEIL